jgi:hypothetical protein
MTHVAAGSRRGIPKAWILPLSGAVLILAAVYAGLLSRSIMVDFLAWWPVWVMVVVLAVLARGRRLGRIRFSGLVPILALLALGLFVTGHAKGWEAMPSATNRLIGPESGSASTVALSAQVAGSLVVGSGEAGYVYGVEPVRGGGDVGSPSALEQVQGANLSVRLEPAIEPGLYTFSGWSLHLDESPLWNLSLGGDIDADLSRLRLEALQVNGSGNVALGAASETAVINVSGTFVMTVPPAVPVRVVGDAVVPDGWVESGEGFASPTPGDGWVISIGEDTSLRVTEG